MDRNTERFTRALLTRTTKCQATVAGTGQSVGVAIELRLRPLLVRDEVTFLAAHHTMEANDGFPFGLGYSSDLAWPEYVRRVAAWRCGMDVRADWVFQTFLVAEVSDEIVGRTSIRHSLNEFLKREGGHIGFAVRSDHRRRGYATEILRQSLVIARSVGVEHVLVTCDDDNAASARVIERCGGTLDTLVESSTGGAPVRRYWID